MKEKILGYLIAQLMSLLTPELLREFIDRVLDFVKAKVLGTASTIDDCTVLPLLSMIRTALGVPEDDDCDTLPQVKPNSH